LPEQKFCVPFPVQTFLPLERVIYNPGKQQGTTFNRDLVAQIAHLMGSRVYTDTKAVQMAELLEPGKGKDHPVRQRLSENPDGNVKKAVEQLFCESCES
jgi:hypothetical protein